MAERTEKVSQEISLDIGFVIREPLEMVPILK